MTKCEVVGLKACTYKNIPLGEAVHVENKEVVTFSGYTNKTYMHIPEEVTVRNMMDGKELKIRQRKTTDINLWNPGSESSTSVVNLGNVPDNNYNKRLLKLAEVENAQEIELKYI